MSPLYSQGGAVVNRMLDLPPPVMVDCLPMSRISTLGRTVAMALLLVSAVHASPIFDPRAEQVILGPRTAPQVAATHGRWDVKHGRVAPVKPRGLWMPDVALLDGTVRARFTHPEHLDVTLLMRAQVNRAGDAVLDGVGINLRGRTVTIVRRQGGEEKPLARSIRTQRRANLEAVEVVMGAFGPHLVVTLYDSRDGSHLGTTVANNVPTTAGTVGVVAGSRWKPPASLALLTTRTACENLPPEPEHAPGLVVQMDPATAAAAFEKGEALEELEGKKRTVFRTDVVTFEHLFCEGRPVLELLTDLPWKYRDPNYMKFRHRLPEETPTGFRIDGSYKNPEMIEALLRGWHRRYPRQTRLERIGASHAGRAIWALAIADDIEQAHRRPAILLNGAHHGSELMSAEFVMDAIQSLLERPDRDANTRRWLNEFVIWCVPQVNPDGAVSFLEQSTGTGRKNGRPVGRTGANGRGEGVDLNRNYPFRWGALGEKGSQSKTSSPYYRGKHAASEPETQAMIDLARREHFLGAISYHTGTIAILAPYTIDKVKNPDPNEAWVIAEEIAAKLKPHPQGDRPFPVRRKLYSVDGVDQDWHRYAHGTVALLVEGAIWTPLEMDVRQAIVDVVRPTWTLLLDRLAAGPRVSGYVRDAEGRPVQAEVRIREIKLHEGERWMTRCRDGRFDRVLARPGRYHVEVRAAGHPIIVREVDVRGPVTLDVRLPRKASPQALCKRWRD